MTEKELKRLSRAELLELLLMQTRESELLQMKLEAAKQELDARELDLRKAGNLADAVLVINGVMESTQNAARQYLDNISRMEQDTRTQCLEMFDEMEQVLVETQLILEEARKDRIPVPEIFREEMASDPGDGQEEDREVSTTPEHPVDEAQDPMKEFWSKITRKALELMHRWGLHPQQDSEGEFDEQAGSL